MFSEVQWDVVMVEIYFISPYTLVYTYSIDYTYAKNTCNFYSMYVIFNRFMGLFIVSIYEV